MSTTPSSRPKHDGFTMVEVMIASTISTMILIGLISFFVSTYSYWYGVNLRMDADSDVNIAMSRMVYGMGDRLGLRTISKVTNFKQNAAGWTLTYTSGGEIPPPQENSFVYSVANRSIILNPGNAQQIVGRDIAEAKLTVGGKVITSAKMITDAQMIDAELCVDKKNRRGTTEASRKSSTTIHFRNVKEDGTLIP